MQNWKPSCDFDEEKAGFCSGESFVDRFECHAIGRAPTVAETCDAFFSDFFESVVESSNLGLRTLKDRRAVNAWRRLKVFEAVSKGQSETTEMFEGDKFVPIMR